MQCDDWDERLRLLTEERDEWADECGKRGGRVGRGRTVVDQSKAPADHVGQQVMAVLIQGRDNRKKGRK